MYVLSLGTVKLHGGVGIEKSGEKFLYLSSSLRSEDKYEYFLERSLIMIMTGAEPSTNFS